MRDAVDGTSGSQSSTNKLPLPRPERSVICSICGNINISSVIAMHMYGLSAGDRCDSVTHLLRKITGRFLVKAARPLARLDFVARASLGLHLNPAFLFFRSSVTLALSSTIAQLTPVALRSCLGPARVPLSLPCLYALARSLPLDLLDPRRTKLNTTVLFFITRDLSARVLPAECLPQTTTRRS